jgi:hypothetical protein
MSGLAVVPDWHADESLYSWAASYHALFGRASSRGTGLILFASAHASKERDAPGDLHHFVAQTSHLAGSVESLLKERTRAGLYLLFSRDKEAALARGMSVGWRVALGMAASGFDPVNRLKYCPECTKQDVMNSGFSRWRMKHLYPGCWLCTEHFIPLVECNVLGQEWILPSDTISDSSAGVPPKDRPIVAMAHLANLCQSLIMADSLDLEAMRALAHVQLRERGITGWGKPLSDRRLATWFRGTQLSLWLQHREDMIGTLADGLWIYRLLRKRNGDHPLRWLIFWSALEADIDPAALARRIGSPFVEPHWSPDGQGLIWSTRAAGVPTDLSLRLSEGADLRQLITENQGSSRAVRKSAVGSFGHTPRELKNRESARQRLTDSTLAIQNYLASRPGCSRNDVLQHCKVHTEWLRRHAPQTLESLLPAPASTLRAQLSLF